MGLGMTVDYYGMRTLSEVGEVFEAVSRERSELREDRDRLREELRAMTDAHRSQASLFVEAMREVRRLTDALDAMIRYARGGSNWSILQEERWLGDHLVLVKRAAKLWREFKQRNPTLPDSFP